MAALFFYLSRNPKAYRKLTDEVRSAFLDAEEIKGGPQLTGCHYLRACFDEALRLSPPVAGTLWFELAKGELEKKGPRVVDGHVIPPETMLGVDIYALHHNELYFPDPFAFKPERWLVKDDPTALHKVNSAFDAFSVGSRGCAGKSMAYLEAGLVIASTLWYFDFETVPGPVGAPGQLVEALGLTVPVASVRENSSFTMASPHLTTGRILSSIPGETIGRNFKNTTRHKGPVIT